MKVLRLVQEAPTSFFKKKKKKVCSQILDSLILDHTIQNTCNKSMLSGKNSDNKTRHDDVDDDLKMTFVFQARLLSTM